MAKLENTLTEFIEFAAVELAIADTSGMKHINLNKPTYKEYQ